MEFDVKTLRMVLAVAECASYSRAAHKLGVTQPAVSRRILQLERELRAKLFRREGHRFLPTEAGISVCEHARQIISLAQGISHSVQEVSGRPSGSVSLGLPSGLGVILASKLVRKFRSKYPEVFVRLEDGYATDLSRMLETKRVDLAILHGKQNSAMFDITPLVKLELGLVYPSAWKRRGPNGKPIPPRIALADTAGFPLILPGPLQSRRTLIEDAYRSLGIPLNIVVECNGLNLAKSLVRDGLGCMIMSSGGLNDRADAEYLEYSQIHDPVIDWETSMAMGRHGEPTLATKLLARLLQSEITELVKAGEWRGTPLASD